MERYSKKYIEQFFSKEIENDWNKIVKNISEIASNQIKNFNIIEKEKFILFIAVQMSRSHKLHNEIINKLLCDENLKKEFLIAHIYKFIKIYNKEQEESNDNIIYCRYKELLKSKLNITILKTNNNFIVSDNPINYYLYNKKKSYLIPINIKICIIIQLDKKDNISVNCISEKETRDINNFLLSNCISHVGFFKDSISNEI